VANANLPTDERCKRCGYPKSAHALPALNVCSQFLPKDDAPLAADLVSRLRASETENRLEPRWPDALLKEAADEIVRLRTALASIVVDDSDPPGYSPVLGDPRDYWEAWAKELERRAREALGSAADVGAPND
jgi:hypothetical protein